MGMFLAGFADDSRQPSCSLKRPVLGVASANTFVIGDSNGAIGRQLADQHDVIAGAQEPAACVERDQDMAGAQLWIREVDADAYPSGDRAGRAARNLLSGHDGFAFGNHTGGNRRQ